MIDLAEPPLLPSSEVKVPDLPVDRILAAAGLLLVHLDDVILLHLQRLRSLVIIDPSAVEEEAEGGDGDPDPLAVGLLELAHLRGLLHAEVDLVAVLPHHLQLDVLGVAHSCEYNRSKSATRQLFKHMLTYYIQQ